MTYALHVVPDPLGPNFDIGTAIPVPDTEEGLLADLGMTKAEFEAWFGAEMGKAVTDTAAEIAEILKHEGSGNDFESQDLDVAGFLCI